MLTVSQHAHLDLLKTVPLQYLIRIFTVNRDRHVLCWYQSLNLHVSLIAILLSVLRLLQFYSKSADLVRFLIAFGLGQLPRILEEILSWSWRHALFLLLL